MIVVLAVVSLLLSPALGALALDRWGRRTLPNHAFDAIVVAGCRVRPDGRPSPAFKRRIALGVRLYWQGKAPVLCFTGAVGESGPSEASAGRDMAVQLGVPARDIVIEEKSRTTEENARFAAEVLSARRVLVVSDAYHVFRCERVFGRYFDVARGTGTRIAPGVGLRQGIRELGALAAYGVAGRL